MDHRELVRVLQEHFGGSQISGRDVITFPSGPHYRLRLRVEEGRIRSVLTGPDFDPAEFEQLQQLVRTRLIDSPGETVARVVLFSSLPVSGWLSMPEVGLQICPVQGSAPRPPVIYADNPFILEFRLSRGGDNFITNQRCTRLAIEWGRVLNAVLRTSIKVVTPRQSSHWGYDSDGDVSKWLPELYFLPDFQQYNDDFSSPDGAPLTLVSHDEYYKSDVRPGADRDELILPDSLPSLLAAFIRLAAPQRRQFLRAATWIDTAARMWDINTSSWFTSLVSAIETFVEADQQDRCPKCESVLGVTRAFIELVERYSPDSDARMRRVIYNYRSKLSHGELLLQIDEAPWAFGAGFSVQEHEASDHLVRVVRDVMVNWLLRFQAIDQRN
ncbi:MAG: hypothetical protein DLM58_01385 [Pseudonocardiales bacterium]|nr:MAG: hypothetical protein DLM58_01385 [Pseudonocardiales bacterium]